MDIEELIKLSKIFKEGFTVECKNGKLNQYTNYKKPYIVSYKTLIEIRSVITTYNKDLVIPDNCIVGGWYNKDIDTYYIELNKAFDHKDTALIFAIHNNQKAIYDIKTGKTITKYKGVRL